MKKTTKSLIIAIASIVVLVGAFLAVYYLLPSQDVDGGETSSNSSDSAEEPQYNLISYSASDIKQIEVENEGGKFTLLSKVQTQKIDSDDGTSSTSSDNVVYTLVGYEDMKLSSSAQTLAENSASVTATKIVNDGSRKSDFGFDDPRSTVTVTTNSGDKKTIIVGDDAPDNKGAYIMIDGDKNVYLVESASIEGFLITEMGMLSTEIGVADTGTDTENEEVKFSKMVFSGSRFDDENIVFEYNNDSNYTETYIITSPDKAVANEDIVTDILSNIRYLSANEVVAVDSDNEKLSEYGFDNPYVTIEAEYPDLKVNYKATKPDGGEFYLLTNGIIYKMTETDVPWINYSYEDLISTNIISPRYDNVDKITIETTDNKYEFDITRTTKTAYDSDKDTDVETTAAAVKCNGKDIDEDNFSTFYNNLTSAQRNGLNDIPSGEKTVLTVTYKFSDGATAKAEYYEGENRKCPVLINGEIGSTAYESYVTRITEDAAKIENGEIVKSIN